MSKLTHIQAANIVKFALETGYRHIDAALIYGQCAYKGALDQFIRDQFIRFSLSLELILNIGNEKQVGEGIAAARIPRSSLWVTGKLWNNAHRRPQFGQRWNKRFTTSD